MLTFEENHSGVDAEEQKRLKNERNQILNVLSALVKKFR